MIMFSDDEKYLVKWENVKMLVDDDDEEDEERGKVFLFFHISERDNIFTVK